MFLFFGLISLCELRTLLLILLQVLFFCLLGIIDQLPRVKLQMTKFNPAGG